MNKYERGKTREIIEGRMQRTKMTEGEGERRNEKRERSTHRKKIKTLTYLHGNDNNQNGGYNTAKCLLVCHTPPLLVHAIVVRSCGYQFVCELWNCTVLKFLYSIIWDS